MMKTENNSIQNYLEQIPEERKIYFKKLYEVISEHLPKGFEENISYGMLGWVVPLSLYPKGYHSSPGQALPFINLASQKNSINFYHMGIYAQKELYDWFVAEFPKYSKRKLDMGKSCIRFKKAEEIPFELMAALVQKMTPEDWIKVYEENFRKKD